MSLALLCAYLFKAPMWKRVTLFVSSMPIAILLNGFRIGIIGVLVDFFGVGAAEGFLHLFEGWVLFILSLAILLFVMKGLSLVGTGAGRQGFSDLLVFAPAGETRPSQGTFRPAMFTGPVPAPWLCGIGLLAVVAVASLSLAGREDIIPVRQSLLNFPMQVEQWQGASFPLERQYIDALKFDDYLLADYRKAAGLPVNFYVAYYRSQRKGQSAHSPRTCIPGGGWEITSLRTVEVPGRNSGAAGLHVNRAVIQKGDAKQVVYYWFKQRDRVIADEYAVKAFLAWDAITRNRTDGALIRLTAPVPLGHEESEADGLLRDFANAIQPVLSRYVPD
jgi:exosortase D (VPLPA-CTERM-specific)